jgi:predicted membrane-bound spermidine synthase
MGIFLVSMAALMFEVLMTRVFSVTMWYHYAFAAISIAMFGLTVGANLVYLFPSYFRLEKSKYHLALYAFNFSLAMGLCFLAYLCIPFIDPKENTLVDFFSVGLVYFVISIPFVFVGICICLALTRFPSQISTLYSFDLMGAALGCVVLYLSLEILDAPTAIFFAAFLASLGSLAFLSEGRSRFLRKFAGGLSIVLIVIVVGNLFQSIQGAPFLKLRWVKGRLEPTPHYEKWNSFSRIQVHGKEEEEVKPTGWGLSSTYVPTQTVRELQMWIDSCAQTNLTNWSGDINRLEFLKNDVINYPYLIRPPRQVLVVGVGAGRDLLSALAFGVDLVTGVELNGNILDVINNRYGDFTGHLDQDRRIRLIHDEARSYITREDQTYDLIQVPMIDTWAATAAGAFVLSENTLYTLEAWRSLLDKVRPEGILSFSRWHVRDSEWEVYRLTSLAVSALKESGISEPRKHLALVSCFTGANNHGIGCLMIAKSPFKETEIDRIERLAAAMRFTIDLSPRIASTTIFENIANGRSLEEFTSNLPVRLDPPTDDSPFFFNMLRFGSMFDRNVWKQDPVGFNLKAVFILGILLFTALILTGLFIILPLVLRADRIHIKGCLSFFLFFGAIGSGFMLVEISQMQRLVIFLGHPTYGLTVVLFSLLLASGVGSLATTRIRNPGFIGFILLLVLLAVLSAFGYYTPEIIAKYRSHTNLERILVAVGILSGIGFFMGTAFPLGMKVALARSSSLTPWLWGINGATSVLASILAVVIALVWGITVAFWCGVCCYGIALIAFIWTCRREGYSIVPQTDRSEPRTIVVEAELVE